MIDDRMQGYILDAGWGGEEDEHPTERIISGWYTGTWSGDSLYGD
jgi:hypothetical protein